MIPSNEYGQRRANLLQKMKDESILVCFAGEPKKCSADEDYPFEVNRNFYYLTGIEQEGSALLLVKSSGETKEFLFILPFDPVKEKWYGKKLTIEEARSLSGIKNVLLKNGLTAKLNSILDPSLEQFGHIATVYLDLEKGQKIEEEADAADYQRSLETVYPDVSVEDCYPLIIDLRLVKSENEVAEFKEAVRITQLGIQSVMAHAKSGIKEYELANQFLHVINDESAYQGLAFSTIMASGKRATVLHYPTPFGTLKNGELLLMDLGARNNYYCADVSRTIPVSGRYSEEQKLIYEIVLGCNKAVAAYAKPGVTINELQSLTREYLASEMVSKGLLANKEDIGNYYYHGVSHHIGLDTHDPGRKDVPLQEGNIISDEPGLYIAERGIGIRIEDDLLITKDVCEVLTKDIIKEIKDIEAFYKNR